MRRPLASPRTYLGALVFVAVLALYSPPAAATPILLEVHAETLFGIYPDSPYITLDGYFTVVPGTGAYWFNTPMGGAGWVPAVGDATSFADEWSIWEVIAADVVFNDGVGGLYPMSLGPPLTPLPNPSQCPFLYPGGSGFVEFPCNPGSWLYGGSMSSWPPNVSLQTSDGGTLGIYYDGWAAAAVGTPVPPGYDTNVPITFTATPVPEPGSLLLLGMGFVGLGAFRKWRG